MNQHYEDVLLAVSAGVATITINRPTIMNAMRAQTVDELIDAFQTAGWDRNIGVIVLTGAGNKAFCTGGDQSTTNGQYPGRGTVGMQIEALQSAIRDVPKPVIARAQGYVIGGGMGLATLCDLTIASASSVFGHVGPRVGSVDPGFGTAYLARIVGEKKAREMWYLCLRYSALEAQAMGLVNIVVPDDQLDAKVAEWCGRILEHSPSALAIAKRSFNADSESIRGISWLGMESVAYLFDTEESREGVRAYLEKRPPDFRRFTK